MGSHMMLPGPSLGRSVHVWKYGHFGPPVVVFPTAAGFAHEWQQQGMVEALGPLLAAGRIKLYCPESNVAEAFTRREADPAWRISRASAYERWVLEVLVPFVYDDCRSARLPIAATGASLGALYAANMALKFPETFHWALCMSGRYEITGFLDGYASHESYFHNPLAYVPNLAGDALRRVRDHTGLTLVCGQGKWEEGCIEETQALGAVLADKGIGCHLDLWGHDVSHDWIWWRRQAQHHLFTRYGS